MELITLLITQYSLLKRCSFNLSFINSNLRMNLWILVQNLPRLFVQSTKKMLWSYPQSFQFQFPNGRVKSLQDVEQRLDSRFYKKKFLESFTEISDIEAIIELSLKSLPKLAIVASTTLISLWVFFLFILHSHGHFLLSANALWHFLLLLLCESSEPGFAPDETMMPKEVRKQQKQEKALHARSLCVPRCQWNTSFLDLAPQLGEVSSPISIYVWLNCSLRIYFREQIRVCLDYRFGI